MKYYLGENIEIGDRVSLADDESGIVVYLIDTGKGSEEHPDGTWDYLKHGVMISFSKYGLHHYPQPELEPDLSLIARRPN